jgi:hypothetical protein
LTQTVPVSSGNFIKFEVSISLSCCAREWTRVLTERGGTFRAAADLGHGGPGTVQEPRAYVLPERTRRRRRLRHHLCRQSPLFLPSFAPADCGRTAVLTSPRVHPSAALARKSPLLDRRTPTPSRSRNRRHARRQQTRPRRSRATPSLDRGGAKVCRRGRVDVYGSERKDGTRGQRSV